MANTIFEDGDVEQQSLLSDDGGIEDGRTPLDKTIDRIGMGNYQWTLLSLCGFGWLADNMWIQAVAIILPRVQQHYDVPDNYIGSVSASMSAGMMMGAVCWGACSDLMGRSAAFNSTLFFTAFFGLLASRASSFLVLCILLFLLGTAVGGTMPTDGTLLLEHIPQSKQYLLTALSIFFSFGAILAAVIALEILPQYSCPTSSPCDVDAQNQGWKYLLIALSLVTLGMCLARIVFFRLHESPRYLVHAGRPQEAIHSLQMISRFNGSNLSLKLEDVEDNRKPVAESSAGHQDSIVHQNLVTRYQSFEATPVLGEHVYSTPSEETPPGIDPIAAEIADKQIPSSLSCAPSNHCHPPRPSPSPSPRHSRHMSVASRRSSIHERSFVFLPRWIRKPLLAWLDRVQMVLAPEWIRTTILVWTTWFTLCIAWTMFTVYLPKLLETRPARGIINVPTTLEDSLKDVVVSTVGGCPGAIVGAFLVESQLGRRWSLAGSTFTTAFFCMVFIMVESAWAIRASTVAISLSSMAMFAVLCGWTPDMFTTKVRGTACGIASALGRIGGMIGPMLGGTLLMMNRSVPVLTSAAIYIVGGLCVLLLRTKGTEGSRGVKERSMH